MAINIEQWLKDNTVDLQGRVVAIVGATGGLGTKVTRYLLKTNAKIIMLDRNVDKMNAFVKELTQEFATAEIDTVQIDLSQMKTVNAAVEQLINRRIDCLILNAGVYNVPLETGELGYNNVFQINFISQYYLAKQLLPALQRTKGKVVAVSSIAHTYGQLDENDIDFTKHQKNTKVYGNSKRFLTFALSELFKDREDVRLAIVHPGVTLTPMTNAKNNAFIRATMKMFFPKPEVAALSIVRGVFLDINYDEWIGPKVAKIWGAPTVSKLPTATAEERAKMYNIAENICKTLQIANQH
ncbi:MAG: SDR family NAD(P)-dependent oxidoreductase [Prevotella sp.]|nr:SDR family NAD(P)-dependent oxidoreductase [Prevotella sp.]